MGINRVVKRNLERQQLASRVRIKGKVAWLDLRKEPIRETKVEKPKDINLIDEMLRG